MQQQLHGVYDVTSFEWTTVRHVADTIAELTGAVVTPGERDGSTPITPIMGKIPGWVPQVTLEDGLRAMTEQTRKQLEGFRATPNRQ
jgi:nucleoside-diphosphate-sugar epimerase